MTAKTLAAHVRALLERGEGDPVGLRLVERMLARAEGLPPSGRARILARADALLERYQQPNEALREVEPAVGDDGWRARLEARAQRRSLRPATERARSTSIAAEIRASAATARAAEQVPEAVGPYHGTIVAARTLEELSALSPDYVSSFAAWLDDLASLAALPERRTVRRKT